MREYRFKGVWGDVQVHLTNSCGHRCVHCYTGSLPVRDQWLDMDLFADILRFVHSNSQRRLRLLGGEIVTPAARVVPYIEAARQQHVRPILATNGYHWHPWERGLIDTSLISEVIISCYGLADAHDAVTSIDGSFLRTMRTISFLAGQSQRQFEVTVNTQITRFNASSFPFFVQSLGRVGVDELKVLDVSPLGAAAANSGQGYRYVRAAPEVQAEALAETLAQKAAGRFGEMRLVLEPHLEDQRPESPLTEACRLNRDSMVTVDHRGRVYPCHLMVHQDEHSIGSLGDRGIERILREYAGKGGGRLLQEKLLPIYGACPARGLECEKHGVQRDGRASGCPLHLELVESAGA